MLKLTAICLATVVMLHSPDVAAQKAPATATDTALASRIDAAIAQYYKADEPGATVIVMRDGKPLLRKAYGMANLAKKQAMTPDTALRLGSITKQFTAVGILMLADDGKLALSDEITKFLPDYPTQGKKITVEHLLTHTSGIVSYTGKPDYVTNMTRDVTVPQMIDSFKNDPLQFEPGSQFRYNNSGYFLLGAIIEKVSGKTYAKFLEERIFVPLGMTDTAYEGAERGTAPRALGYSQDGKGFSVSQPLSMSQPYAAGSLVSTVDDLAKWDAAIGSGKLLKPATLARAFTPYTLTDGKPTGYGYGWGMTKLRDAPAISHGGGINGFTTYAMRLPEQKVYVALLTNADSGHARTEVVAQQAAAIAIGKPFPELKAITLDDKALDGFSGVFKIDDKTNRTFRRSKEGLMMQRTGGRLVPLVPYAKDAFFIKDSFVTLTFTRNDKGEITQVTMDEDGEKNMASRIGDLPPEPAGIKLSHAAFDTLVGRYEIAPGAVIEISRDGDTFHGQMTRQPKLQLIALSEKEFAVKEVEAKVRFEKSAQGEEQLVLIQNGREMPGKRLK